MERRHTYTAILFLAGLLLGAGLLFSAFFGGEGHLEGALRALIQGQEELEPGQSRLDAFLARAEREANRDLDRHHSFIQLYGGLQRLAGRRLVEDMADPTYTVVKLSDGALTFENLDAQPVDVAPHAQKVARLGSELEERFGIPLLYVQAPQKARGELLPAGVEDYGNGYADTMLAVLEQEGVDTLDLRPALEAASEEPDAPLMFFRTDHHWTPEGAFVGYQALSERLREDYGFVIPEGHTDPESYRKTVYEDWFLGSQGKRVGTLYGGTDDITLWEPEFPTSFTYSAPTGGVDKTGTFAQALLFPERVAERDYFSGNPYTLYAGGDYSLARIYNHQNQQGKRILLIRDSYACALTPFLALDCAELITVDMRYFQDDLMTYVDWLKPDLVCVMYGASSTRLPELFAFQAED